MLVWNVRGLKRNTVNHEFRSLCQNYDVVCLLETFCTEVDNINCLDDYVEFTFPAIRKSARGRPSGGVVVYIKQCYAKKVSKVQSTLENAIFILFDKELFLFGKNVLLCCYYNRPDNATDGIHFLSEQTI